MTIAPTVLAQMPLPEVRSVIFYKRDEVTTDLICCDVQVASRVWTFHEEMTGWRDLIIHLSAPPDFLADWFEVVVCPPFSTSVTVAFERR